MKVWNVNRLNQWIGHRSLNTLEEAYQGALTIQTIEDKHFGGDAVMAQPDKGKTVTDYFKTQCDRQLLRIRTNLLQFRVTGFLNNRSAVSSAVEGQENASESIILEKLAFIESIVGKYRRSTEGWEGLELLDPKVQTITPEVLDPDPPGALVENSSDLEPRESNQNTSGLRKADAPEPSLPKTKAQRNNLPTSSRLFGGVSQIGKEFSSKYEQEVVQELRVRRSQGRMAVRWLAILFIVPLLVQISVKHAILNPIFVEYSDRYPSKVELSERFEEKFLLKFGHYKEILEIKSLLAKATLEKEKEQPEKHKSKPESEEALALAVYGENSLELMQDTLRFQPGNFRGLMSVVASSPEVEAALEEKALEEKALDLWREEREEQLNGLKNIIADGSALAAFAALVYVGRSKLTVLRSFSNRAFLGLNDPTKVFLFILFTDMFVGFHSAEGWEVILESISEHLGFPESKLFINGFIATVPVVIDSCVKFWIFSYLTRYSPSTSAIYERMHT